MIHNIFRIKPDGSMMCGFYCINFIKYMVAAKTMIDYTNLFSRNDYQKKQQDNI